MAHDIEVVRKYIKACNLLREVERDTPLSSDLNLTVLRMLDHAKHVAPLRRDLNDHELHTFSNTCSVCMGK